MSGKGSSRRGSDKASAERYAAGWDRSFAAKCCKPKKVATVCRPKYPPWTCSECATAAGGRLRNPAGTTWHVGYCPVCDRRRALTEPRDYGWPDFKLPLGSTQKGV